MTWGLDRLGKIASGLGGGLFSAIQAPFGLVKDAWTAGYDQSEDTTLASVFSQDVPERASQVFRGLLGPESGIGTAVGGLPEFVRAPGREVLEGATAAYREGVAEPLSTILTVGSLAESATYQGLTGESSTGNVFRKQTWRDAYKISQHRSPGQAFALTFTDDVMDNDEVEEFKRTDAFTIISGTADAVTNLVADPTAVALGGAAAARRAVIVKPISGMNDLEKVAAVKRLQRFDTAVAKTTEGMDTAQATAAIRHRFFPNHPAGPALSSLLAEAPDQAARMRVIRAAAGDVDELDALRADSAALGNRMARAQGVRPSIDVLEEQRGALPRGHADEVAALDRELDELYAEQNTIARREAAYASLQNVPRAAAVDTLRSTVTRSDFYQKSRFAAPVRVVFDMRPQRLVNLEEATGDVQVARILRKSALPLEEQERLRGTYAMAVDAGQRERALIQAEEAAVRATAEAAGMTPEQVQTLLNVAGKNRSAAAAVLKSRTYDGEGRSLLKLRGDGPPTDLPLLVSQTANVLPLVDMDAVRRATTRLGQFAIRHPGTTVPVELAEGFTRLWKPAVLFRPAWPMRVVLDEQLRILSKVGAMGTLRAASAGLLNTADDAIRGSRLAAEREVALGRKLKSGERKALRRELRADRTPGQRQLEVRGYEVEPAFGPADAQPNIYKRLASSRASFDKFFGRTAEDLEDGLRRDVTNTGEWRSITPDEPSYAAAWSHAVNRQIGQDALARRLLENPDQGAAVEWLRNDPEGQRYARRVPYRRNLDHWVGQVAEQVNSYLPTPELQAAALAGKVTTDLLAREVPDAAMRPVVHGEVLAQTLENSVVSKFMHRAVNNVYAALGSAPTDALSRQPFFDHMYQAEVKRLVNLLDEQRPGGLTNADIKLVEQRARRYALKETKDTLYDLAESSELSHLLRFVSPFFNAWQEVGTVWAGIAVENPAYVRRLTIAYQAPNKAGLIQKDERGEEYVVLPVPRGAKDLPYVGEALRSTGDFRFNKASVNTILGGMPGTGPLVQMPVYLIAKDRPDLASNDFVSKTIFPFGVPGSLRDLLLPATAKRLYSLNKEEEDRAYATSFAQIMATETVNYNRGLRPQKPTYAEVRAKTKRLYALRTFVSFASPVGGTFDSPYQMHIEAYRNLREQDPMTADARFLEQYGEDYFALTTSVSRTVDGVPATIEAWQARRRSEGLIAELNDPKMAALIVGAEGAGEFNRAVYEYQLVTSITPGSDRTQRERQSQSEVAAGPEVRLGWLQYRKLMDTLDNELERRGLRHYQQADAEDLRAIKKNAVASLAERYPAWFNDYNTFDRGTQTKRIEDMRMIVADAKLSQRPDIQGLAQYLRIRDAVVRELGTRDAKTLKAQSNADVETVFQSAVDNLVLTNVAFADLYRRWLDRDSPVAA